MDLPPGRHVDLPGRGRTWVRELEGPPGAPTVLLLHGWTATSDLNWFGCYESLGRAYRVVALDHRGHGRGIRTRRLFRLDDCADDAAALVGELGLGPVIVVGYSMGGLVAQLLWKRHPAIVQALVLCATSRVFIRSLRERQRFALLGAAALASRVVPSGFTADTIARVINARSTAGPFEGWAADELRRNDWTTVLEAGRALGHFDSRPWIGDVDVPTAVVAPMRDTLVSPRRQVALARAIPGATLYPVQGDHTVCATHPHRFGPVLLDALADVSARSAARSRPAAPR